VEGYDAKWQQPEPQPAFVFILNTSPCSPVTQQIMAESKEIEAGSGGKRI
jgi:hypothetical protein